MGQPDDDDSRVTAQFPAGPAAVPHRFDVVVAGAIHNARGSGILAARGPFAGEPSADVRGGRDRRPFAPGAPTQFSRSHRRRRVPHASVPAVATFGGLLRRRSGRRCAAAVWWISRDSGIDSQSFVGWHYGWTKETESLPWFWFKNTGLFIPLIVAAVAARGRWRILPQRLLLFYLPFIGCFIVPQLVRLAPRPSANIKVLIYWYIASTLLVAMALARVWRAGAAAKAIVVALIATLTLSAGLDVWRVTSGASAARVFDSDGVALAALVERATPPDAVLLHAPIRQAPTSLSGRPSVLADLLHVGWHGSPTPQKGGRRSHLCRRSRFSRSDAAIPGRLRRSRACRAAHARRTRQYVQEP